MAQQRILHLIEQPDHTPENPSLAEDIVAKHNLIDVQGISPTAEELKAEETRLLEEYASSQYQRDRRYPRVGDQLDLLWHAIDDETLDKTSDFYTKLKKVKDDNPKG